MKVFIIGNGGREHALVWKVSMSPLVTEVFVTNANAGMLQESKVTSVTIDINNIDSLVSFAHSSGIELTIVGPELPLSRGVVDAFEKKGLLCFGPSYKAAILEYSKSFAKNFLFRHSISTPSYRTFTHFEQAINYLNECSFPLVIKDNGLCNGKGVTIVDNLEEGKRVISNILFETNNMSKKVVIEDFIYGKELSFICLVDGDTIIPFPTCQDYKKLCNGNQGPNTGGMGSFSPVPWVDENLYTEIIDNIVNPTIAGLKSDEIYYRGFLYFGIIVDHNKNPQVLEFNCRLGDPEAQCLLMKLETDLVELIYNIMTDKTLPVVEWNDNYTTCVVMASHNYPNACDLGCIITGLDQDVDGVKIFHSNTILQNEQFATNGGRVLSVVGNASTLDDAIILTYNVVNGIIWDKVHFRTDVGM